MSVTLPVELEPYVVPGNPGQSLVAAAEAAARGDLAYDLVGKLARVISRGGEPRFPKTRPVSLRILEYIELHKNKMDPMKAIWVGVNEKLWSFEEAEAYVHNRQVLSEARNKQPPNKRGVFVTRKRFGHLKRPKVEGMFLPKIALDVFLDPRISDGACRCLGVLLATADKSQALKLVTFTKSLATLLNRSPRTVRNYYSDLEQAGLIRRSAGTTPNTVHIELAEECLPEPYKERLDVKAFKVARRSNNTAIRQLADTLTLMTWKQHEDELRPEGGRKEISPFNLESILKQKGEAQKPRSTGPTTHSSLRYTKPKFFYQKLSSPVAASLAFERRNPDQATGPNLLIQSDCPLPPRRTGSARPSGAGFHPNVKVLADG